MPPPAVREAVAARLRELKEEAAALRAQLGSGPRASRELEEVGLRAMYLVGTAGSRTSGCIAPLVALVAVPGPVVNPKPVPVEGSATDDGETAFSCSVRMASSVVNIRLSHGRLAERARREAVTGLLGAALRAI